MAYTVPIAFLLFNINCVPRIAFICIFAAKWAYIWHKMAKTTSILKQISNFSKRIFKRCINAMDLPCVYVGVLIMMLIYIFKLTNYTALLLLPVILIILGIIGYVHRQKTEGKYWFGFLSFFLLLYIFLKPTLRYFVSMMTVVIQCVLLPSYSVYHVRHINCTAAAEQSPCANKGVCRKGLTPLLLTNMLGAERRSKTI